MTAYLIYHQIPTPPLDSFCYHLRPGLNYFMPVTTCSLSFPSPLLSLVCSKHCHQIVLKQLLPYIIASSKPSTSFTLSIEQSRNISDQHLRFFTVWPQPVHGSRFLLLLPHLHMNPLLDPVCFLYYSLLILDVLSVLQVCSFPLNIILPFRPPHPPLIHVFKFYLNVEN